MKKAYFIQQLIIVTTLLFICLNLTWSKPAALQSGAVNPLVVYNDTLHFGVISKCSNKLDSVVLVNNTDKDVVIPGEAELDGPDPEYFEIVRQPASLPFTLKAGSQAAYVIRFKPLDNSPGYKNAKLVITIPTETLPKLETRLDGTIENMDITASPSPLDFSSVPVGTNPSAKVLLTNNSNVSAHITAIRTSSPDISVLPQTASLPDLNSIAEFDVTWNVTNPGSFNEKIIFLFDEPCNDSLVVLVTGRGLAVDIGITPTIDYGANAFCQTAYDTLYIENKGETNVEVRNMYLTGDDEADFFFTDAINFPILLNGNGGIIKRAVVFRPVTTDAGSRSAEIATVIMINGKEETFRTRLEAVLVQPEFSPVNKDFGVVLTGKKSDQKLLLQNTTVLPVIIHSVSLLNSSSVFSVSPDNPGIAVNPGEEASISVSFAPVLEQVYSDIAVFNVEINDCQLTWQMPIKGTGRNRKNVEIAVPEHKELAGIPFDYPVTMNVSTGDTVFNLDYTIILKMDDRIFDYIDIHNAALANNKISGGYRFLEIKGSRDTITVSNTVLAILKGRLMVSDIAYSPVLIDSLQISDSSLVITRKNGSFETGILCQPLQHDVRFSSLPQVSVYPNPSGGLVTLNVTNAGKNKLIVSIYSVDGNKVYSDVIDNNTGKLNKEINLEMLSSGYYRTVIDIGKTRKIIPLLITR